MKLRAAIFSFIICLFLVGPGMLLVCQEGLKLEIPGWLSAENATYLTGGNEKINRKDISPSGFISGKMQTTMDAAINYFIPMRYSALLLNAGMQRTAIESSNTLFDFDVYPTFFNSPSVYIPEQNALTAYPSDSKNALAKATESVAGICTVAAKHPEKNFYLVVADRSQFSSANPAQSLISNSVSTEDYIASMTAQIENLSNVHIVCDLIDSLDEYYESYYKSDHHWNGYGTILVYKKLQDVATLPYSIEEPLEWISFGDFVTNGAYARDGLMLVNQKPLEPHYDLQNLEILSDNPPAVALEDGKEDLLSRDLMATNNFYSQWYGSAALTGKSPIQNNNSPQEKNAVIICDSYANSLHWLIAKNYEYTRCFEDIYDGAKGDETLMQRIEEVDADDIYFVGAPNAYTRLIGSFPHYFDE